MMLLMKAAKEKGEMQNSKVPAPVPTPEQVQQATEQVQQHTKDLAMLRDPMVTSWIEKALRSS